MFSVKYPSVNSKNQSIFPVRALFFALLSTVIIFTACEDGDDHVRRNDHQYIPLRKGWFQIYDVEETRYQLGNPETNRYQLKAVVADSFPNAEGNYTYVVHLSKKSAGSDEWLANATHSVRINTKEAVVSEGSTAYVVLSFPVVQGISWNGNAYNDVINPNTNTGLDVYTVESAGVQVVNSKEFLDCVSVQQEDNNETIVFKDQRREVYARNVGLILKETTQLHYCNDEDRNCIGQEIIDEGIIYKQQILSYGVE